MAFNNEIEKTEGEIKVLQAKLELLKEMENHKSPEEEAYKRFFGRYFNSGDCWTDDNEEFWYFFQVGYRSAKEDCKVEEPKPMDDVINRLENKYKKAEENAASYMTDEVIDRVVKKYQAQKLWNMVRNELGYSVDCVNEIVDLVERWLPKEQSAEGSQNSFAIDATEGFNHCLNKIKGTLR